MSVSIEALAREFSQRLKSEISTADMIELVEKNRAETSQRICHSHDYCDANVVLH